MTKEYDMCKDCLRDQCPLHCPGLSSKKQQQSPQAAPEAVSECMNIETLIMNIRSYISVTACRCHGATVCWRCTFKKDLEYLDNQRR